MEGAALSHPLLRVQIRQNSAMVNGLVAVDPVLMVCELIPGTVETGMFPYDYSAASNAGRIPHFLARASTSGSGFMPPVHVGSVRDMAAAQTPVSNER